MDPNAENAEYSGFRKSAQWPDEILPPGVTKDDAAFYAYERVYNDGRREWVFYRRGKPLAEGETPNDKPIATVPDKPVASVKTAYDKEKEKGSKPPEERNNNGRRERWNPTTGAWDDVGVAVNATAPAAAGTEVTRAAEAKAKREREESEANAALPPDQDPRYETNEARAKRAQETIKQQGADAVAADERARRDRLDQEARDAKAKADAAANRPKDGRESIRGKDGKPYVKVTKVDPASGKSEVYYENEAGQRVPPPEEKPADIADPTDMPAPTFVVGDAAKDLRDFDVYLAGKIGTGPGKITQAKADQLRENRRKLWEVALGEQQGLVNTQKSEADRRTNERGQTLSDQGNRRNSATSIANQATSSLMPYMDKMGAGANGADFVAALRYLRDSSQDFVTSTGANAYVPNVTPGPALTTINNASIPAPGSAPAAPFLSPTRPAAAVAPAFTPQPMAPPPAGPSQAAAATAAAQAAQRGAAAAAPPVPAPVAAPSPGYNPGNAQQAADAGLVPGQNPYQWSPDDQPLAPAPLFNAKPPEQQTLPLLPPQPGSPAGGNVQMMPTAAPFLSMTRGPQQQAAYDPMPSVQSMIDDPEWDNEAVQQAYFEMYGKRLPMSA